jgi:hypothetical protein
MKTKIIFFIVVLTMPLLVNAQYQNCSSNRYYDSLFTVKVYQDVTFGQNLNYDGTSRTLTMDIYVPDSTDTISKRPLILFAPKGSFLSEDKREWVMVQLCRTFAQKGFVTAAIDYRIGVNYVAAISNPQKEFSMAVMRATHDYRAAIRFFRKDAATTNVYKIDPDMIIAGGSSAGAITALHVAYLDKVSEVPTVIDTTGLGGIEGLSGNSGYPSNAQFVINLCGAIADTTWMEPGNIPLVSMHGNLDTEVPYATATIAMIIPIMEVDGSASINARCNNLAIYNPFHTFWGVTHIPFDPNAAGSYLQYMDTVLTYVRDELYGWLCLGTKAPQQEVAEDNILINQFGATIQIDGLKENAVVTVTDLLGKQLYSGVSEGETHRIDVEKFVSGIYIVNIAGRSVNKSVKLVYNR